MEKEGRRVAKMSTTPAVAQDDPLTRHAFASPLCLDSTPHSATKKEQEEKNERGGWCGREGLTGLGERRVLSYRDWVMRHRGKKKN